jgi:hypothetical protein
VRFRLVARLAVFVVLVSLVAAPYIAAAIEINQKEFLGVCNRPTDADFSTFDQGEVSLRLFPPGVRCTWQNTREVHEFFPTFGTGLVAAALLAGEAAVGAWAWVAVRRRRTRSDPN